MKWKNLSLLILLAVILVVPKRVEAATVVNINHETGDLSQYDSVSDSDGELSVREDAGLAGTHHGLKVVLEDMNSAKAYKNVSQAGKLRGRFYVDPNSFNAASGNGVSILAGNQVTSPNHQFVNANLLYVMNGLYGLSITYNDDSVHQAFYDYVEISDEPHYVEFYIVRATNATSHDGSFQWWLDGADQGSGSGIDNYNDLSDTGLNFWMGANGNIGSVSGSYYMDELVVNDDGGVIGPAVPVSNNLPASSKYKLEGFAFGNAGGGAAASSNYSVDASVGEAGGVKTSGGSFDLGAGLMFVQQANTPKALSFTNSANNYDKLHLVISDQNNPSDTRYAIAISPDNFATTFFVKSDHSIGSSMALTDYQTYGLWGGEDGFDIIGLLSSTTYSVKIKAIQGKYSETGYGPVATAATVAQALTFDIDVAHTDTQTTPPYIVVLDDLNPGTVVSSYDNVWVSLNTNANNGGSVFVYGQNGGLYSVAAGYTIPTVSGDLGLLPNGFGVHVSSLTQASGGPFTIDVGYSGAGNIVGITDTRVRQIFLTNSPIVAGRASFVVKAKSDNSTPSASDYTETLTVIAAANY